MDVRMLTPFHYRGRLWCYLANVAHWSDTGGMVPGGFTSTATEIQQEGLRIPPVKIQRRGELDRDVQQMVLCNVRVPEERLGDLKAQMSALKVGAKRLTELLDRYGADTVDAAIGEFKARSERMMRAHISTVPNGTYQATVWNDSDGVVFEKLAIRLTMTVVDTDITFSFAGSSPPCKGPMNCPADLATSGIYIAMKHVFPDVPINAGCFAPIRVERPVGTFLDAQYPRPCAGAAAEVCQRVMESVFGAMGQAIPERMFAAPFGTSGNFSLGGYDPAEDRRYIMYMFSGGGYGGWAEGDGLTNGCSSLSIAKTQPIEVLEQAFPILYEEYAIREGSAGAGRNRGGFGLNYRVKLLRGEAKAAFVMDHGVTGPAGLLGGEPGGTLAIEISQEGRRVLPPHVSKGEGYVLGVGDWIQVRTPGGGGYGPAAERSAEATARDESRGYYGHPR
jgi:N-methylhydantoinase B